MTRYCFVTTDVHTESSRWLLYAAHALRADTTTFYALEHSELKADVYVLERECWRFPWQRVRNQRVLTWIDDAYHLMPRLSPNYSMWQDLLPAFWRILKRCDGIIAPNALLCADYAEGTKAAYYIPNYHDFPEQPDSDLVLSDFGWAGSWCHWASWRDTQLYNYMPRGSRINIVGHRAVADMLKGHGLNVYASDSLSFNAYLERVATWGTYVMPVHGEYDRRRSWIKALEAVYCGVPWLAVGNATDIYREVPGGKRFNHASEVLEEEWHPAFDDAAQTWAEQQRITNHLEEWEDALNG